MTALETTSSPSSVKAQQSGCC